MTATDDNRPGLAVIAQELTPYRRHLHRRIVAEIPELRLSTLLTHDPLRSDWRRLDDPTIGVVRFGEGQVAQHKKGWASAARFEVDEAARVVNWLECHRTAAILAIGYSELPLFRPLWWAHRRGIPILFWADANIRGDRATGVRRLLKKVIFSRVVSWSGAILPCGSLGRAYFMKYGASPGRIFLSPCEPDYEEIALVSPQEVAEVVARFSLQPGRRRILCCGRFLQLKRQDLALDAFVKIADQRPEWDLVFAGDGPTRADLERRTPDHLRERVIFTGFLGDQRLVSAIYRHADLLVHLSDHDAWALVLNEAAAAGLAIVATDVVGAAAELVKDGVNGKVVPPGDLAAVVAALLEVTRKDRIDVMRSASLEILADWRRRADPIKGLRQALHSVGVLPGADVAEAKRQALRSST